MMLLTAATAFADDCCNRCGCESQCRRVCRLVCDTATVSKNCYGCKCEQFCVGEKQCRGDHHCEQVCMGGGQCGEQRPDCSLEWFEYEPLCATLHSRKQLIKYTVEKKVPSYKWVVETLCDDCCQMAHSDQEDDHHDFVADEQIRAQPAAATSRRQVR
jgi:hypothetical protein